MKTKMTILALSLSMFWTALAFAAPANDKTVHVATCNDGKEMYSATNQHRGACASHGGVKVWGDGTPVKSHAKKSDYR